MAEKVPTEVDCSKCQKNYTDPRLLQCLHAYCHKCLVTLVKDRDGQLSLSCPTCNQTTLIPPNGVAGLQPAFHINRLLELAGADKDTPQDKTKICCREHAGKEVDLYCLACEEPVCLKCVIVGAKHHGHDCDTLDQAFEKYKAEITASLEPMEKQLATVKEAKTRFDKRHVEISGKQQTDIEGDVHEAFRRIHEVLNVREKEVIDQLRQMTKRKLKALAVQEDQIKIALAKIESCIGFLRESLQTGNQGEVLMMKTAVVKQVKKLTTTFPPDMLEPNTKADMLFSASADTIPACKKYGQILDPSLVDPSRCHATGNGLKVAVVGETSSAVFHTISYGNEHCREQVSCELVSEITGTRTLGSIERKGSYQYNTSYQPTIKGRHQLHIKVEGQHIRGSPFSVAVKSPVEKLGTPLTTIKEISGARSVAINKKREVLVTDVVNHCVTVFSPSGEKLRSFGVRGSGQGQFNCPRGVVVDGGGNILVVDNGNHRIQKFSSEGQFITSVGAKGSGQLQFCHPRDIAFNVLNSKLYITDSNHCVQVLNSDLTFYKSFGKEKRERVELPRGIACDSAGNVYVADTNNHRIQVFTAEGKFLRMFGRRGEGRGELNSPQGVAVDTSDMVYVSDKNNCVSVFTSGGELVTSFGSPTRQPLNPRGLCVDSSGVLYVCDAKNKCIIAF